MNRGNRIFDLFPTLMLLIKKKNYYPSKPSSASFLPNKGTKRRALHLPKVTYVLCSPTPSPVDKVPTTPPTLQCVLPEGSSPLSVAPSPLQAADPATPFIWATPVSGHQLCPAHLGKGRHQYPACTCGSPAPGTLWEDSPVPGNPDCFCPA